MRVVSGKYGSRPLKAVPGDNTRPTTDKIKESIFNMIGNGVREANVLDFYAGSGGLGIEAASRGARQVIFCERYRPAWDTIQKNIQMTKEEERFTLLKGDNQQALRKFIVKHPDLVFNLVFLDPPYRAQQMIKDIEYLDSLGVLASDCCIMCETDKETELDTKIRDFEMIKSKNYGQTQIRIYSRGDL